MPNNSLSQLPIAQNYTLRNLQERNDFSDVYDLSGGYCKLSLWIEKMNMPNGYKMFGSTDNKYEKSFIGRDHVIAQMNTVTQSGNTLIITLFPVGTPPQAYNAFRVGDGVLSADMGVWGKVESASPGQVTISPVGEGITISDLVTAYTANGYIKAVGDFNKNDNSGGKSRLAQYPDVDYNYAGIKRDSWYNSGRESVNSRVKWDGEYWSDGFADATVMRLLKKREFQQIWGVRDRRPDTNGDVFDSNGGVRWSTINRGGEYLPLSAAITENQFDNFLANMDSKKRIDSPLTMFMGKGMLHHIQRNFTQGYMVYTGMDNTFGGSSVKGLNVLEYTIANMPVKFVELQALNDQELFPEVSSIPGLALPNRMGHTMFCVDMAPIPIDGGAGMAPAIELITPRKTPILAGYLNGMDKAATASQVSSALTANSGSQVVTDIDGSSFHALIDDGIDMTGKFSGWVELTS